MVWKQIVFQRFFRVLFLIPMMTTPVIMTVVWRTFFHESLGPVNDFFSLFGMQPLWLSSEILSKFTVILVEVWQWTPFMFLLLLAGLLSLPKEPYLAASIDGAGPVRTFVYVTFPLMAPISIGAIIIRLIEASKIMDTVYVLTSGGPGTATETSSFYIFIKGLREFQFGYSAALSLTLLLAGLLSLPKEPYLAASIDGAGPVRTFVYVTFPLMAPISIGAIIIRLIEASKIMDTVYVLTSGGPGTATETSSFYIFIKGLREFQFGYSAALSLTYLVIMIISFTIIAKILTKLMVRGS